MISITDERLKNAAGKLADNLIAAVQPEICKDHTFSEGFCEGLEAIFDNNTETLCALQNADALKDPAVRPTALKRFLRTVKHAAAVIIVLICVFTAVMIISPAARAWTAGWIRTIQSNSVIYRILISGDDKPLDEFIPGWLPEDLQETSRQEDKDHMTVSYSSKDNSRHLKIEQICADEKLLEDFNKEISGASDKEQIPGGFAYHIGDRLTWYDESRNSIFSVEGNLDYKEELWPVVTSLTFDYPEYEVQWAAEMFSEKEIIHGDWDGWHGGGMVRYYNGTSIYRADEYLSFHYGYQMGFGGSSIRIKEIKNGEIIYDEPDLLEIEPVRIGKLSGDYVTYRVSDARESRQRPAVKILFWFDEDAGLVFSLLGSQKFTKEDLVEAAESIRLVSR